jgi:hypothetical protein
VTGRCSDACLFHWPAVVRAARTDFERRFARDIEVKARAPWWKPKPKQLTLMQRMVDDLFPPVAGSMQLEGSGADDVELIERD